MAIKLGSPRTTKFSIGTAELRIGQLTRAMRLKQENSIGLIDNATVEVSQETVDLTGGFPKVLVDTAVVSQESSITATLREYSRRNLQVLLGEGVVDVASEPTDIATTVDASASAAAVVVPVADESAFAVNDMVIIFGSTDATKADVTVGKVVSLQVGVSITLDADTPLLHDVISGDIVYKANQVAIGNILETNYFCVQLLQLERATARPIGFDFWKGAIGGGMTFATNAEDFASTELSIKLLQPAATEYAAGADLEHLANIIPSHPTGMYFGGGDA
jgi:lipid-A-disaccharide synthase-like uncharacterized protein